MRHRDPCWYVLLPDKRAFALESEEEVEQIVNQHPLLVDLPPLTPYEWALIGADRSFALPPGAHLNVY